MAPLAVAGYTWPPVGGGALVSHPLVLVFATQGTDNGTEDADTAESPKYEQDGHVGCAERAADVRPPRKRALWEEG